MRYVRKLFTFLVLALLMDSCKIELSQVAPEGFRVAGVSVNDTDPCNIRYTVTFHDPDNLSSMDYWVGLAVKSSGEWNVLAFSDTESKDPPFTNVSITFECRTQTTSDWQNVYAVVARGQGLAPGQTSWATVVSSSNTVNTPIIPASCCNFEIALTANGVTVDSSWPVMITSTPSMPNLIASVAGGSPGATVAWRLRITYNRIGRYDTSFYPVTGPYTTQSANSWSVPILPGEFRGGQALLSCYSPSLGCTKYFSFCIRGENPDESTVESYIVTRPSAMWYWKYVAMHESYCEQQGRCYAQFNTEYDGRYMGCDVADAYAIAGTVNASTDGGFGICQLTWFGSPARVPNSNELWSWIQNVNSGTAWLAQKQTGADSYLQVEVLQAIDALGLQGGTPRDTTYDYIHGSVTFSYGTGTAHQHAIALKRYNSVSGQGNGEWCEFRESNAMWYFNTRNRDSLDYVRSVCSTIWE